MKWTERIGQRNGGKEPDAPWWVNDKFKLHQWATDNGLPMPKMLRSWKTPDEIDLSGLPTRFVLKPSVMFSTWGVMLLERMPNGKYWESLKSRELTLEQIKAEQELAYGHCKYKGSYRVIVEERVESPYEGEAIPLDYKVYSFYGQPYLIHQINRNVTPVRFAFFDGAFDPLDLDYAIVSDWKSRPKDQPVRPDEWEELLRIAGEVTRVLRTPYMSVDMFVGQNGPVIGELTPSPGDAFYRNNFHFSDAFDQQLGDEWTAAEERIRRDS